MKNYTTFARDFQIFKMNHLAKKQGLASVESYGENTDNFINDLDSILDKVKMFTIDEETKKLLMLSTPPKLNDHLKLPFSHLFIDTKFTSEDFRMVNGDDIIDVFNLGKCRIKEVMGIVLRRGNLLTKSGTHNELNEKKAGDALRITILSKFEVLEGSRPFIFFDTFYEDVNLKEEYADMDVTQTSINPIVKKFIYNFVISFINFTNNPEVEIIEVERSDSQNLKRIKRGKIPIPSIQSVKVTGKLKIYLDELKNSGLLNDENFYSHRFWVRGFYRTLRSVRRYGENVGKRVWILPHIRGVGLLVEKEYYVEHKKP